MPAHNALSIQQFLAEKTIAMLEQPLYSPDLAPVANLKLHKARIVENYTAHSLSHGSLARLRRFKTKRFCVCDTFVMLNCLMVIEDVVSYVNPDACKGDTGEASGMILRCRSATCPVVLRYRVTWRRLCDAVLALSRVCHMERVSPLFAGAHALLVYTHIMKEAQALGMDSEQVSKLIQEEQKSAKEKAGREERAAERELKRCQLQSEEADKQRAHDKSMAELRLQNAFEGNSNSVLGNDSLQIYEGLKLPTFNDGQDDIDSYLQRFKRFAKLHKWNKEDYHVYLGSLLRGQALKVYVSLPDDTISNYQKLKEALLRAYSVDANMYRRKFRESKCQDRETYVQSVARMEQYLDRWISLSNISKDFNSLFDFLIREQLLSNCNSDMRIFLKEREFVTAVEMAESADRFRSAHLYRGKRTNQTPIFKATQSVKEGNSEMTCHGCGKLTPKNSMFDPNGYIFDKPAEMMLDSGCSSIIVKESLVPSKYKLGKFVKVYTIRDRVEIGSVEKVKSRSVKYERINGLIYRVCLHSKDEHELNNMQLVIPAVYKDKVLQHAHDSLTAGHFSHRKTSLKVFETFFWPGAGADIKRYCKSCHICQKVSPKGRVKRVPMKTVPVIQEPISRVAIDIVGPLSPSSDRGHRYILTLIDCATRYPEAIPLKNIDTITIAESLVVIFSRVGIPREVLSDRGTQFRSDLMSEIHRLLSINALYTTPYHASCNGMVERLDGVLKSMLKKLCPVHPRDWDRYIPATLFAYREMPNDSLKFSPFELLYGRTVRGPLNILHELWSNNEINHEVKSTYQYVTDLRTRLEETAKLAAAKAEISSRNYKYYYDLKAKHRKLEVGDEVLVLLPTDHNKLIMQWQGPYPVVSCKDNGVDYSIKAHGKNKLYHINMLKMYHRRESISSKEKVLLVCVVEESNTENQPMYCESSITSLNDKELNVNEGLSSEQVSDIKGLITDFSDVFSDVPGYTKSIEHVIKLESNVPVSKKPFPIPHHLVLVFDKEVDRMLKLGIIEPSNSPYCSPVVLVRKSDQTWRFCIDFRGLNDITSFDCEPMPTIEDALGNFSNDVYFSELDLTKGYWQIPLSKVSKIYTAFATSRGLMQFVMMPFGLKTACATFVRLMRIVTCGLKNTDCYFDNIVVHNSNWSEHLQDLRELLNRLRLHGLTAGISKCYFGYPKIKYLGLLLGDNALTPLDVRVNSISEMPFPNTKKDIAAPLNDMLKKLSSNKLTWSDVQIYSFQSLKAKLSNNPVLCLPDYKKTFYLRTDASDNGLGAVLLQDVNDMKMPIAYASRKLLERERNYATIEKECLAIIWAVDKFKNYLFGKEFVLQTDQQPLTYLRNKKNSNSRLMRWSLILQCYSYRIEYIKGNDNIGADILSRCLV
ncbi:uncharacterized protein [Penaeus vannamei]|uniref:uncharacterized protein n=1 Tax=Penaeus vannamei TaxID=6689 RepID=UPI00387F8C90